MIDEIESEAVSFLKGDSEKAPGLIDRLMNELYEDLLTEGFDDEQVYQQIEHGLTLSILDERDDFELFEPQDFGDSEEEEDQQAENEAGSEEGEEESQLDQAEDDEEDEEVSEGDEPSAKRTRVNLEEEDEDFEGEESEKEDTEPAPKKQYQKTQLDDEFFSLREMEEMCEKQEEGDPDQAVLDEDLMEELYGDGDLEENEQEGLFDGDDDDEDEEKGGIMASDFFGPSTFEKRSKRVEEELAELEAEQIKQKPWHLMGETTARQREGDELLAMDLDYEATRPTVAPTVQQTEQLENIIIQRIRDKAYDDVERKTREMVEPAAAMRKLVPDEERKSLSALYEQEFLQNNNKDAEEDPVRKEIKANMEKLFNKLDFLTYDTVVNQKEVEVKVISGSSALVSEEKGPSMLSQFQSLAPEEVGGRSKGAFKLKEERTTAEIKRDRRQIKLKIKAKKAAGVEIKFKNPKKKSDADLRPESGKKTKWTNSSKVFRLLQEENETGALTAKAAKKAKKVELMEKRRAKSFKL